MLALVRSPNGIEKLRLKARVCVPAEKPSHRRGQVALTPYLPAITRVQYLIPSPVTEGLLREASL